MFMVANRSVGHTCSAVFSSWMWINETVFSCVMCYTYGIAAPMWFGTDLVPHAHSSLEIVRKRYATLGHVVFIILNLINNITGCASMIVTGCQLLVGITGMHLAAATILIPATFLTDFLHTTIPLILIVYFTLSVLTSGQIGGIHGLYDKCKGAVLFSISLQLGNLALVVIDTVALWQKSFASEVRSTVPGCDLAALVIYAVPWALGSVIGLSARALEKTPGFPTYPNGLTAHQVSAGYVMPYTIHGIIGTRGSAGMLLLLFMAVTSTVSSSLIAVSSIISFDGYRTYINPHATDSQIVTVSHLGVVGHGNLITAVTLALNYGGVDITWMTYAMHILQSKLAAVLSPVLGMISGIAVRLGTVRSLYTEINEKYDWSEFLRIELVKESGNDTDDNLNAGEKERTKSDDVNLFPSKTCTNLKQSAEVMASVAHGPESHPLDASTLAYLQRWYKIAWIFLITIVLATFVAWPMLLYRD
ncbi:hypothetical protein BJ170DRAFT_700968 [Xylariales sp. AK1849]|nr:hypothetical protein BJ170DRAFT_700968 [Xylariales sp. AK1849]